MRFGTRTFLWSFVPVALLLMGAFWVIQTEVVSTVRSGIRSSLRDNQVSIARVHSKSELQNNRFLRIVSENAALKAGVQLLLADPRGRDARLTVEDQLREICQTLGFDFLMISNLDGAALAGMMRLGEELVAIDLTRTTPPQRGFFTVAGHTHQITSIPVDQGDEHIATLSVGERFDFSEFSTPAVLLHNGKVLLANIPAASPAEIEAALASCPAPGECEMRLRGETFLSVPMDSIYFGDGYVLRSLQSLDSATRPVQSILRGVFVVAGIGSLAAMLILSVLSARSIVGPISKVVTHLRESQKTGVLPEFSKQPGQLQEIQALTESFNDAAAVIREGRDRLHRAYVEFIGSLANAIDARDRSTAGHSNRVSELSCDIATAMNISGEAWQTIRIGALLHDVGKIGIADSVLQKPGRLTREEFALIQQHPSIGRRILEGVRGFEPYLAAVELHHENWDGSGYPHGLRGEATPLPARIVHVADVFDAVTSDRPYRPGMSNQEALLLMEEFAGTQFDPDIIDVFLKLPGIRRLREFAACTGPGVVPLRQLADAINGEAPLPLRQELES